jgi:hypothetical protein
MVEVVQALKKKIYSFELFMKTKDCAIKDVQSRITFMCNALGKLGSLEIFIKKKKAEVESRQVEEIKILDDIPLATLESCTIDNYILFCKIMLVILLLILTKQVLVLLLLIMLYYERND